MPKAANAAVPAGPTMRPIAGNRQVWSPVVRAILNPLRDHSAKSEPRNTSCIDVLCLRTYPLPYRHRTLCRPRRHLGEIRSRKAATLAGLMARCRELKVEEYEYMGKVNGSLFIYGLLTAKLTRGLVVECLPTNPGRPPKTRATRET
jgi:hypothetical protein